MRPRLSLPLLFLLLAWGTLTEAQEERATVRLDGRAVLRVSGIRGQEARERADAVEHRLETILQHEGKLPPIRVESTGGGANRTLSVLGVPLVTLTPEDAQDHLSSPDALAADWARTLNEALAQAQARRRAPGGRFGAEVIAAIRSAFAGVVESTITVIPRALAALLVLLLFWAVAAGTRWLLRQLFRRIIEDLTVENLLRQVTNYFLWALGVVVAVDALGIDRRNIVAGLGLTGLALGFALKDILSNFVSGLLLLALRPFRVGDQIIVGDTEGTVERVVLRATQLRTYDGRAVHVPNAEVLTSRFTNNTQAPIRRASFQVYLDYDADLPRALDVFLAAVKSTPGALPDPPPSLQVSELGANDVVVDVRFWTDSRRSDFVETMSEVRKAILAAAKSEAIPLPDPDQRFITFRNGPS